MSDKDPEKQKEEKKNTDLWKQKQEEKKKKKEAETQGQGQIKTDKKEKKKKEKEEKKDEEKKSEEHPKKEEKTDKLRKQSMTKKVEEHLPPQQIQVKYKTLKKLDNLIDPRDKASRIDQEELITKYMEQYLSDKDIVLYIGQKPRISKNQQIYVQGMNKCSNAEFVCRFSDLSYFLEGSVTKIFIEAEVIFSNGSILAKQGALSVALMGNFYKIPVVVVGGSWNYNGWGPTSYEALEERYGIQSLSNLDWIEDKYIRSSVTQVGIINPRQVSIYPPLIYKNLSLGCQW